METTITLHAETKAALAEQKADDETWDEFAQSFIGRDREAVPCRPVGPVDLTDAERERLIRELTAVLEELRGGW